MPDKTKWASALPKHLPRPTYWPAIFALACVLIFFGVVTKWVVSAVGMILFIISLIGWIGEMRNEQRTES